MSKLKKGTEIFYVEWKRGKGYEQTLFSTDVTHVGTKYFATKIDSRSKISYENRISGNQSDNHNLYFFTKEDYEIWVRKNELLNELRKANIDNYTFYNKVAKMSVQDIEMILQIFQKYNK